MFYVPLFKKSNEVSRTFGNLCLLVQFLVSMKPQGFFAQTRINYYLKSPYFCAIGEIMLFSSETRGLMPSEPTPANSYEGVNHNYVDFFY